MKRERPWRLWYDSGTSFWIYTPGFASRESALRGAQRKLDAGELVSRDGYLTTSMLGRRLYVGVRTLEALVVDEGGKVRVADAA